MPDGNKNYQAFLRDLSWCATPANVPKHAQASLTNEQEKYSSLHPGWINTEATRSFVHYGSPADCRAAVQTVDSDSRTKVKDFSLFPALGVSDVRNSTYRGPESMSASRGISSSTMLSTSKGGTEVEGDALFMGGKFAAALSKYNAAMATRHHDIGLLTKRCAVLAHLGKYEDALMDAVTLCQCEGSSKSINRKKALEKQIEVVKSAGVGYENSHITLLHLITPPAFKQW